MPTISGTAVDKPDSPLYNSGVKENKIKVYYIDLGTTYYWTGTEFSSWSYPVDGLLTSGTTNWSYTCPRFQDNSAWVDGVMYYVEVKSKDEADNESLWVKNRFIFDSVAPVVPVINVPIHLRSYDNLTQITGTAQDVHSRIGKVQIYIQDVTRGTTYWDNLTSTWVANATPVWFDVGTYDSAQVTWIYTIGSPQTMFRDGNTYDIKSRAIDVAGSTSTATGIRRFFHDVSNPYSTIVPPPVAGLYYKEIPTIQGTSYDDTAGVNTVQVGIQNITDGDKWWTGANTGNPVLDWDVSEQWLNCNVNGFVGDKVRSWSVDIGSHAWISGKSYRLRVRTQDYVIDNPHYEGGTPLGAVKVEPFYIDKNNPTFATVLPEHNKKYKT
jgi:hypothetical protein